MRISLPMPVWGSLIHSHAARTTSKDTISIRVLRLFIRAGESAFPQGLQAYSGQQQEKEGKQCIDQFPFQELLLPADQLPIKQSELKLPCAEFHDPRIVAHVIHYVHNEFPISKSLTGIAVVSQGLGPEGSLIEEHFVGGYITVGENKN